MSEHVFPVRVSGVSMMIPTSVLRSQLLCAILALGVSRGWGAHEGSTSIGLGEDGECEGTSDEPGGFSALQRRSHKLGGAEGEATGPSGSCERYGCGATYKSGRNCQCNSKCSDHNNCCPDYRSLCTPLPSLAKKKPRPAKEAPKATYENFTLVLSEDFDSPLDLDNHPIWTWSDGGLIEGQVRFTKEAIKFADGKMKIEVSHKKYPTQSCSHAESAEIQPKKLSSGELRTKHNMFRYGRYEVRMKAPAVQPGNHLINGNYVSTMFVFRDGKFRHWREIDFELTGDSPHSITTNVLSADSTKKWRADIAEARAFRSDTNLRARFHTYAFEWPPDRISWYVDGKLIREKVGGHLPIPDTSAKIMLNLWVFGDRALFGGKEIWNNRYPMHSEYDWIRFYKWNGDEDYPCPALGTSCLTADDMYLSSNNPCDGIPQKGMMFGNAPCAAVYDVWQRTLR